MSPLLRLLHARLQYLRVILPISLAVVVCTLVAFVAFHFTSLSVQISLGVSLTTAVLTLLDLRRGHSVQHAFYVQFWYHLCTTLALSGFATYALVLWFLDDKDNPIQWWTTSTVIFMRRFISCLLPLHTVLLVLKLAALMVAALYQLFLGHTKIWLSNIMDWNWSNTPMNVGPPHRGNFLSIWVLGLSRTESDPVLVLHRRLAGQMFRGRSAEPVILARARGIVATIICLALFLYGAVSVLVGGSRERSISPIQTFLGHVPNPLQNDRVEPVWSVFVAIDNEALDVSVPLFDAVTVVPMWDTEYLSPWIGDQTLPSCLFSYEDTNSYSSYNTSGTRVGQFVCPDFLRRTLSATNWMNPRMSMPDLLVSVDYDKLNIPPGKQLSMFRTLLVQVGLTNETDVVLRSSYFFPLVRGTHNLASIRLNVRRSLPAQSLSFGIGDPYSNYFTAELHAIGPNPSVPITPNDNTASVLLFTHYNVFEWNIIQDQRQHSILEVFSALGGIWTFSNGIFTIIFGGSMLLLLGIKPLPVFGLVHSLFGNGIRKRLRAEFPRLQEEAFRQHPAGLNAFLEQYVLDLSMLQKVKEEIGDQEEASIPLHKEHSDAEFA